MRNLGKTNALEVKIASPVPGGKFTRKGRGNCDRIYNRNRNRRKRKPLGPSRLCLSLKSYPAESNFSALSPSNPGAVTVTKTRGQ